MRGKQLCILHLKVLCGPGSVVLFFISCDCYISLTSSATILFQMPVGLRAQSLPSGTGYGTSEKRTVMYRTAIQPISPLLAMQLAVPSQARDLSRIVKRVTILPILT